jgi:hypothetical protein
VTTGKFNIFVRLELKTPSMLKMLFYMIDDIDGAYRTETMISLEESINDK